MADDRYFDGQEDELVRCPICRGGACKFCDGYGTVHPADIPLIVKDHKRKQFFTAIGIIFFLVVIGGGSAAGYLIYQDSKTKSTGKENPDAASSENGETAGSASDDTKPSGPRQPKTEAEKQRKSVFMIILDMRLQLKSLNYEKVIELGDQALPNADEVQKKNINEMMEKARKGMGQ